MKDTQNEITLAHIVEEWVKRLPRGEIHYHPGTVESRTVTSTNGLNFKVTLNRGRQNRPEKKAA